MKTIPWALSCSHFLGWYIPVCSTALLGSNLLCQQELNLDITALPLCFSLSISLKSHSICGISIIFLWCLKLSNSNRNIHCMHAHLCLTLSNTMDSSPPDTSVHGIFQARIPERVAVSYSRGSPQRRDWTCFSCNSYIGRQVLDPWAIWEVHRNIWSCWNYLKRALFGRWIQTVSSQVVNCSHLQKFSKGHLNKK